MVEFLYIHIPFCIQKCLYCDFFSVPYDVTMVNDYTGSLCKELILKKGFASTLKTVYIGGGTPTLLSEECFQRMFTCLKDNYNFSSPIEITVEANPCTINKSKINTMLLSGVNRLSVGIQSFSDIELQKLGRIYGSSDAINSIKMIKNSGITNYSIDLMYGIPGQTMDSWKETLSKAVSLSPAHISSYELTLEKNTPLYEIITARAAGYVVSHSFSDTLKIPDEDIVIEMYNYAIDYLADCGLEHYEISNFAIPGYRCIHNLNYWDRGEYIGIGAGAHSFIGNLRSENTKDLRLYIENLEEDKIPETVSTSINPDESLKELLFLGLRKKEGIDIYELKVSESALFEKCDELFKEGYIEIKEGHLRLTRKGICISNIIIVKLFEMLGV